MSFPVFASMVLKIEFINDMPEWVSGTALHGLFFRYIRAADKNISEKVHATEVKSFSLSLLRAVKGKDNEFHWKISILDQELYIILSTLFYNEWRKQRIRKLVGCDYVISDCIMDGAGRTTLWHPDDLVKASKPSEYMPIRLVSPSAFKKGGKQVTLFPEPGILWNGILRRLHVLCPGLVDIHNLRPLVPDLLVSEYHLGTRQMEFPGYIMKGVVGRIMYMAPRTFSKSILNDLGILLQAVPFLGVGTKTSHGMGECLIWRKRTDY